MRRLLTIAASGVAGGGLVILTVASRVQSAVFLTFLVMGVAGVLATRTSRGGRTYRDLFVAFAGSGLIATGALILWLFLGSKPPARLSQTLVLRFISLGGFVLFGSALAAAIAWKPPAGETPVFRRRLIGILIACGAFTVTALLSTGAWFIRSWDMLALDVSWYVYFAVFYFGLASAVIYLPILIGVGRVVRARTLMAVIGAALFPIPVIALDIIEGRTLYHLSDVQRLASIWPRVVEGVLPYIIGGAVLGWLLSKREPSREMAAHEG